MHLKINLPKRALRSISAYPLREDAVVREVISQKSMVDLNKNLKGGVSYGGDLVKAVA